MEKKIDEMNKGIFRYSLPELLISKESIEESVGVGEEYDGSILIDNSEKRVFKGVVYSDHEMVEIKDAVFAGIKNEIHYRFNAKQAVPDDKITGKITIVSDCGEVSVPFTFTILKKAYDSSIGMISDLNGFAELARNDELEALRIFNSPQFDQILLNRDVKNEILYRSLCRGYSKSIAMEEFLAAARKKSIVEISVKSKSFKIDVSRDIVKESIIIEKNTWGHCELEVYTDSDFISLGENATIVDGHDYVKIGIGSLIGDGRGIVSPKLDEILEGEDYQPETGDDVTEGESRIINVDAKELEENGVTIADAPKKHSKKGQKRNLNVVQYDVEFFVDPDKMREGCNEGKIYIHNINGTLTIDVHCDLQRGVPNERVNDEYKKDKITFIKNYLGFRMGETALDDYLKQCENIVTRLSRLEDNGLNELYRIHLQIISGNSKRAIEMLAELEKRLDSKDSVDILVRCGYMYLKTLVCKEDAMIKLASKSVMSCYEKNNNAWQILWILLYINKKYEEDYSLKYRDIKKQYEHGCTSPIMYYEVCATLNKEYTLLHKLDPFEIQALNWGTKNNIVSEDVALTYASIAIRMKDFNQVVYRTLVRLYEVYPLNEILAAICSILIKGEKYNNSYFKWYKLGVEHQLKITQLFESYMYAYDENSNEVLPEALLIYFGFNSNMSDAKKAFIYANVIKNRHNIPLTYESYKKQIEKFMNKQLEQHIINENMKVIYEEFLTENSITEEVAKQLPLIMFRHDIFCYNPNFVGVVVVHKVLSIEQYATFTDGKAQINIFAEGTEIFLVDRFGNRYSRNNAYTLKKLLNFDNFIDKCFELNPSDGMLIINLGDKIDNYLREDTDGRRIRKKLIDVPHLRDEYRRKYLYDLIQYTYDNGETELLDYYLGIIDIAQMYPRERSYVIEYYILRGFRDKAVDAILTYGYSNIPAKRLVKLATKVIGVFDDDKTSRMVLRICAFSFENGKYDENILKYLVDNYNGSTMNMFKLWKTAYDFQITTTTLEERLLAQMLFAECYIPDVVEVFRSYYRNYSNIKVVRAFLMYNSYKYIVRDRVIGEVIFEIIKKELAYDFNEIYVMAMLKNYSAKPELTLKELTFVDNNIKYFSNKSIVLPFFKTFADKLQLPENIADKYYVQYIADPAVNVVINYSLMEGDNASDFEKEIMKNTYLGIRVKEFILFYGDNLQYYIAEESEDESVITESMNISVGDSCIEEDSRYSKINLMLLTRAMNDEKTLVEAMKGLTITDYIADNIYTPL